MIELISPYGGDFPVLHLETELCTADVSLYGAQLLNWTPRGHKPVLWLSPQASFRQGKAIRGGIPLCWPWFGPHGSDASQPAHGIARLSYWTLAGTETHPDGAVTLKLKLMPEDPNLPEAGLDLTMGNSLAMRLQTTARQQSLPYSAAFHSYFHVGDREQCTIPGLEEIPFEEFATKAIPHEEAPLRPLGPIDRIYCPTEGDVWLHDPVYSRRIRIARQGSRSFVVWNPGHDMAAGMADIGGGNERQFLCAEATVVPKEGLILRAGEQHTLACAIEVMPLATIPLPA